MNGADFLKSIEQNPSMAAGGVILLSAILFLIARYGIARWLINLTARTSNQYDDIVIRNLHPNRLAWLAPLALIYTTAFLFPDYQPILAKASLFIIMWIAIFTLNGILNAVNEIYEKRKTYNGVSIQSYLDIVKILTVMVGIILSITLITEESPWVLLTGLGALTAVLLIIFQSTILSLVASVQIVANDLLKEGDWVEVPSYEADGDVTNINLHSIKIRNFDMTYTVIPTYKIVDVAFKNWRGMKESGGRRIQRSVSVDMISIKFCDKEMLERLSRIDLVQAWLNEKIATLQAYQQEHSDHYDSPLDGPQITNIEIFREYISAYLRNRADINHDGMPFLVRVLSPTPTGLPIELYIFARTTDWAAYELTQAEIFDHLLAAASNFDLRVFQEPTGLDFATFTGSLKSSASHFLPG
ncbi:MAG TPA: mechanosensitive ion channel [Anaerolinea sp.]|nr:mechanosensitive ion channel [Anaerolinea sp.]